MVDAVQLSLVAVFFVLFGVVAMYLLRRLRWRRNVKLETDLGGPAAYVDDRSYNQIRMARSEADILRGRGVDVRRADALLEEAESAMSRRDYSNAYTTAHHAHELLVKLQPLPAAMGAPLMPTAPVVGPRPATLLSAAPDDPVTPLAPDGSESAPSVRLEKNQAESRFQLSILRDELQRRASPADTTSGRPQAEAVQRDAEAAYAKGAYTDALRLALKARRTLGARIETLPPPTARAAPPPSGGGGTEGSDTTTPCPQCGRAMRADDKFCRGCGAPRMTSNCPRCHQPTTAADVFCANCGSPLT